MRPMCGRAGRDGGGQAYGGRALLAQRRWPPAGARRVAAPLQGVVVSSALADFSLLCLLPGERDGQTAVLGAESLKDGTLELQATLSRAVAAEAKLEETRGQVGGLLKHLLPAALGELPDALACRQDRWEALVAGAAGGELHGPPRASQLLRDALRGGWARPEPWGGGGRGGFTPQSGRCATRAE